MLTNIEQQSPRQPDESPRCKMTWNLWRKFNDKLILYLGDNAVTMATSWTKLDAFGYEMIYEHIFLKTVVPKQAWQAAGTFRRSHHFVTNLYSLYLTFFISIIRRVSVDIFAAHLSSVFYKHSTHIMIVHTFL